MAHIVRAEGVNGNDRNGGREQNFAHAYPL
jgi:hypothetical protein